MAGCLGRINEGCFNIIVENVCVLGTENESYKHSGPQKGYGAVAIFLHLVAHKNGEGDQRHNKRTDVFKGHKSVFKPSALICSIVPAEEEDKVNNYKSKQL